MVEVRTRNARGEGSRLRDEIVAAAIAMIDQGEVPLSLRGVARRAGISAPSVYPHFADLEAVAAAVLERSFAELESEVAAAVETVADPREALIAAGAAYVRFGRRKPARFRFMFAGEGFAPDAVATFAVVEGLIGRCAAEGASASTDPHGDAFLVWVALHGLAVLEKPARPELRRLGPIDRDAAVGELVRRLARLVR